MCKEKERERDEPVLWRIWCWACAKNGGRATRVSIVIEEAWDYCGCGNSSEKMDKEQVVYWNLMKENSVLF